MSKMGRAVKKYSFCPYCAGEVVSQYVERGGKKREVCTSCGWVFYRNSKPCVGALVIDGGKVLLVRRTREPFKGYWDIPGGFLEAGEHPEEGVVREVREETGLEVKPTEILGIFMDKYGLTGEDTLNIHYIAEVVGGKAHAGSDAAELKWFDKRNLPRKIAFRNGREALRAWQRKDA